MGPRVFHQGPQRAKWNGDRPLSPATAAFVSAASTLALAGSVVLMLKAPSMKLPQGFAAIFVTLLLLSSIGRIADQRHDPKRFLGGEAGQAMLETVALLPVLGLLVFSSPSGRLDVA